MTLTAPRRYVKGRVAGFDLKDASLVLYLPLYYPYSDMTGTTIYSYDKNRLSFTVTGASWGSQGRTADGVDDEIVSGSNIGISGTDSRTLGCWTKFDSTMLAADTIAQAVGWGAYDGADPRKSFTIAAYPYDHTGGWAMWGTAGDVASVSTLTAGKWYCLFATFDGTTVRLYNNGATDGSGTPALNTTNTTLKLFTKPGTAADRYWCKGTDGEIWIYNRVLTQGEIANIYLATRGRY